MTAIIPDDEMVETIRAKLTWIKRHPEDKTDLYPTCIRLLNILDKQRLALVTVQDIMREILTAKSEHTS